MSILHLNIDINSLTSNMTLFSHQDIDHEKDFFKKSSKP